MASLALTVVGTAVAGPWGGLLGGMIGTYLDQAFILPAIFGRPTGPRLEDLQVQTAAEGSNAREVFGPENRTAGTLIDASDFIEDANSSKKGPTTYTYRVHLAVAFHVGRPVRRINRVWADSKIIYDRGTLDGRVGDLRIYRGTDTQTQDPLLEARDPGRTPAYRGTAYIVIENLDTTDWGNRIPNVSAEIEADVALPVQQAIDRIAEDAGIEDAAVNTSRVPGCVRGYTMLGPQETTRKLDPLMTAFFLSARDDNGVLTFFRRGEEDRYGEIPTTDLGAHEDGQEPENRPVTINDKREYELPSSVTVQHFDPDWDLQQGSQRERLVAPVNPDAATVTLPLTLKRSEARSIAKVLLYAGHTERQLVRFTLPPSYLRLQEGDIVTVEVSSTGQTADVRVTDLECGHNFILRAGGHITNLDTYDQTADVDAAPGGSTGIAEPSALTWHILDIPAITSNHQQLLGFYVAAVYRDTEARWSGTRAFRSADGVNFEDAWAHQRESGVGRALTMLADYAASPLWVDYVNTVDVLLYEGTLSSSTEAAVLAGANRVLIGDEIVGFITATLIGTRTYRLSGLLRGLRDTAAAVGLHAPEERVVVLSTDSLVFWTGLEQSDVGAQRHYRNVPVGADAAEAPITVHTPAAGTLRHFTPCHLSATKDDTNNDCHLSWVRRSRAIVAPFASGGAPLLDSSEEYDIEVRYAEGVPVRTVRVSGSTSWTYTEAMQTADGLTPGTSGFFLYVYQISSSAGRSRAATVYYSPSA